MNENRATFGFFVFAWRGLDKACQIVKGRGSAQRKVIASLKPKMLSNLGSEGCCHIYFTCV